MIGSNLDVLPQERSLVPLLNVVSCASGTDSSVLPCGWPGPIGRPWAHLRRHKSGDRRPAFSGPLHFTFHSETTPRSILREISRLTWLRWQGKGRCRP